MARDKDFKRLVRQRMQATHERYTVARAALRRPVERSPSDLDAQKRWISLLADPDRGDDAYTRLEAQPADSLRTVAIQGLVHESWRVRRRCARLLDDLALTDETIAALEDCLKDQHPGVRQAALHTLICEGCKPEKCDLDVRAISESMLSDPHEKVRRQAVGGLRGSDDEATIELLKRIAQRDKSIRVREFASEVLGDKELRRAGAMAWRALPDQLRTKTRKHEGKWVAIVGDRVLTADRFRGQIRRDLKGRGSRDAVLVWVPSEPEDPPDR